MDDQDANVSLHCGPMMTRINLLTHCDCQVQGVVSWTAVVKSHYVTKQRAALSYKLCGII